MAGVCFGRETNNVFCVALCCPLYQVCATPVSFNSYLKLCPVPCLCHLLVPMSCSLGCGFFVRLAVCANHSVPVLLCPVLYCLYMHSSVSIALALSCSSLCKMVTEFLHQSGSSCGQDRTHPGIIDVRPRHTSVGVSVCINWNC